MADELERLITDGMRACLGTTLPPIDLPEEIAASDVRRFLEAVGDTNPLYRDDKYARRFGYRSRPVPPMLVIQLYRRGEQFDGEEGGGSSAWPGLELPDGYTNTRNAGHEIEWVSPAYLGDRLTLQQKLVDMYVRQGRAGVPVIYLVREVEIRNQRGEVVVRQRSTTAKLPEGPSRE